MSNSRGIIYTEVIDGVRHGVSINDIQTVIGSSLKDIGGLITQGDINKWAKYKPVKMSGLDFGSQRNSDFTWKSASDAGGPATWWKAYNGQCGLTFTTYASLYTGNSPFADGSFLRKLITSPWPSELVWGYERPTGGINQYPFRFFDFLYYSHYAPQPIIGAYNNLRVSSDGSLTVQFDMARAEEDLGIQLFDIIINNSSVSNWYLGALVYLSSSVGEYAFAFSDDTIGNGSTNVHFNNMNVFGGRNVKIVPFLSSVRANQNTSPGPGVFLSCDVQPQTLLVRASVNPIDTTVDAIWVTSLHVRVRYAVNINNNTGNTLTITNLRISLYEDNVEVDFKPNRTITIALNENWQEESMLVFGYSYDPTKTYTVRVTSASPTNINESVVVNDARN